MDDSYLVGRRERIGHLPDEREGLLGRHTSHATQTLGKCFAAQQLHGQKGDLGVGALGSAAGGR